MLAILAYVAMKGAPHEESEDSGSPIQLHRGLRQQITGFQFNGLSQGKKTLSIYADKLTVQRKKIGVFRFGLSNEVRLENAHIKVYLDTAGSEVRLNKKRGEKNSKLGLNALVSRDTFSATGVKRITSVVMSPVRIQLIRKNSLMAEITATQAGVRARKRDLMFKGDVRLISGDKVLEAARILVDPKSMRVECDKGFVLRSSHKVRRGGHLVTDIFLSRVNIPCTSAGTTTNNQ